MSCGASKASAASISPPCRGRARAHDRAQKAVHPCIGMLPLLAMLLFAACQRDAVRAAATSELASAPMSVDIAASAPHGAAREEAAMQALVDVYGPASAEGFGSAVLAASGVTEVTLEAAALAQYRAFVGTAWNAREAAWRGGFKALYQRPTAGGRIDTELHALQGPALRGVVGAMIEDSEDPARARAALAGVFDASEVRALRLYALGDGEAMSGVEVAALREGGDAVFLILLLD